MGSHLEPNPARSREVIRGGVLMVAVSGLLLGTIYGLTGQLPRQNILLLCACVAALGCLRLAIGLWPAKAPPVEANVEAQERPQETATPEVLPLADAPMTQLQYDYWLLGLDPSATFAEVRRAHQERKAECLTQNSVDAAQFLAEINGAYRRLRRLAQPRIDQVADIQPLRALS